MSADPDIETGLPQDAKGAWMITKFWQVYDNLKFLLDNPEEIKKYADSGYDFALNHYTYEKTSEYLHQVFKENGIEV
jgi:spore maturation protein CgeB